ncbi:hypothetical protein ACUTF1_30365, partial [Burkholderia pseudomallei]
DAAGRIREADSASVRMRGTRKTACGYRRPFFLGVRLGAGCRCALDVECRMSNAARGAMNVGY